MSEAIACETCGSVFEPTAGEGQCPLCASQGDTPEPEPSADEPEGLIDIRALGQKMHGAVVETHSDPNALPSFGGGGFGGLPQGNPPRMVEEGLAVLHASQRRQRRAARLEPWWWRAWMVWMVLCLGAIGWALWKIVQRLL